MNTLLGFSLNDDKNFLCWQGERARAGVEHMKINRTGLDWGIFVVCFLVWAVCMFFTFKFVDVVEWVDLWWLINELIQDEPLSSEAGGERERMWKNLRRDLWLICNEFHRNLLIDLMSFFKSFSYQFLIALSPPSRRSSLLILEFSSRSNSGKNSSSSPSWALSEAARVGGKNWFSLMLCRYFMMIQFMTVRESEGSNNPSNKN